MIPFFSEKGKKAIAQLTEKTYIAVFDFDGTLAPIVPEPDRAKMTKEVERSLRELMRKISVVVISGRGKADLRKRLRGVHPQLVGNHGMEGIGVEKDTLLRAEKIRRSWASQLRGVSFEKGVFFEEKKYSLTLHYREASRGSRAREKILKKLDDLRPTPRIVLGKKVINLIPSQMPNKGDALLSIMKQTKVSRAIFFGDDITDEDVFDLRDSRVMTVRVGRRQRSSAQFFLKRQEAIARAIQTLVRSS